MTYSVYQHWDPLKVCAVGRSYPPEFYQWIKDKKVRKLFEKIAVETEEDYQNVIAVLEKFGVSVVRTHITDETFVNGRYLPPPMMPRDVTAMIGEKFYYTKPSLCFASFYNDVKDPSWPACDSLEEFYKLPQWIIDECFQLHDLQKCMAMTKQNQIIEYQYKDVFQALKQQGNQIIGVDSSRMYSSGAMVSRIGRDLYVGTPHYDADQEKLRQECQKEFPEYRIHIVNSGGHSDGTYCPVCPGLIISLYDIPNYTDTFPDWEVVYLPNQSWNAVRPFVDLRDKNDGKWWIPGFEYDLDVINTVETWLNHWTGYVEETVFDVNMLILDPKNVVVFSYNKQVFDALDRYGITPHIVPFRHRYFWDGGVHCITSDLHREGQMQDFFTERQT